MYKVRGQDGREYGPVPAEIIRQWMAEGRLNAQSLMQAEGTDDWKPLGEFAEFQAGTPPGPLPVSGQAGPSPATVPGARPQQTLAITSLVLGILSLTCLGLLAGIPAIITGHIARGRARRQPELHGGPGLALAGTIMGYASIALTAVLLLGMLLPAVTKAKGRAQTINCVNNLKQIALAARIYSNDHKDTLPLDFEAMSKELVSPRILVCPADSTHKAAATWSQFSKDANVTYEFLLPGAKDTDAVNKVVFRCPIHNNVAMGDGSVQMAGTGRGRRPR